MPTFFLTGFCIAFLTFLAIVFTAKKHKNAAYAWSSIFLAVWFCMKGTLFRREGAEHYEAVVGGLLVIIITILSRDLGFEGESDD